MYKYHHPKPIIIKLNDELGFRLRQNAAEYITKNQNITGAERGSKEEQGFGALAEMVVRNKLGMPEINPENHPLGYDILLPLGVKLDVTPHIFSETEEIGLEISGEVSSIGKTTVQGYPYIITRSVNTFIRLKNGYTAILGGLLKEETRETRIGIPFLMDIPLLGYLFGGTKHENIVTEVRIALTPTIVNESMLTPPVQPAVEPVENKEKTEEKNPK